MFRNVGASNRSQCATCAAINVRRVRTSARAQVAQLCPCAIRATPLGLDRRLTHGKSQSAGGVFERMRQFMVIEFGDLAAGPANQKLCRVIGIAVTDTADIRRHALQFVDQPMFQQELKRPIHSRRGRAMAGRTQPVQQVVGTGRGLGFQYQPQNLTPQVGEASAFGLADLARVDSAVFRSGGKTPYGAPWP